MAVGLAELGGGSCSRHSMDRKSPHPGLLIRYAHKRAALPTRGRETMKRRLFL